ncbi:hypothetical protein E2C06_20535 [Dankookia rubra]|uniref:Uncharacterized protein n=1 Tax=Dankookia rubra TaxID=1442381 RepID=A0A4V3A9V9_9PROT|nr:hypothetical protein [Dankookia rubra]TDH60755.1 hypothetical protein E2C06_20535 [Dankookia rubra]
MPQTVAAFFDSIEPAERAAYSLGVRFGGVRAHVCSSRTADSGLPALSLPLPDLAVLTEGIRRGGAAVWAEVPEDSLKPVAAALRADGAVDLTARGVEWRREGWIG